MTDPNAYLKETKETIYCRQATDPGFLTLQQSSTICLRAIYFLIVMTAMDLTNELHKFKKRKYTLDYQVYCYTLLFYLIFCLIKCLVMRTPTIWYFKIYSVIRKLWFPCSKNRIFSFSCGSFFLILLILQWMWLFQLTSIQTVVLVFPVRGTALLHSLLSMFFGTETNLFLSL